MDNGVVTAGDGHGGGGREYRGINDNGKIQ